jgi:hypothetical protein
MTVITRSALIFHGHNPAPEVHSVVIDHRGPGGRRVVTWAEVMDARRQRQRELLRRKLDTPQVRAYKLWVAYFEQNLMGGWHAFLEDHHGAGYRIWIDRDMNWMEAVIMAAFPVVDTVGTERQQWNAWKLAFAQHFARRVHDGRPCGVAYLWWDRRNSAVRPARWPL